MSDVPFSSNDLTATLNQPGVSAYYVSGAVGSSTSIPVGRTGRYVRVQLAGTNYLALAEVEVFGVPAPAPTPTPTPTPTSTPTPVQPPVLAAYWAFNDFGSGIATSGYGHHGTLVNGPTWTTGQVISALSFDGVNDVVSTNGISDVTNNFTVAFWALPSATHEIDPESTGNISGTSGQRYALFPAWYDSGHSGAGISVGTNGVSVYEHAVAYMPALLVYQANLTSWTHVAVVYQNKQPRLYINGVLVRTGLTSLKDVIHLNPAYIGGQSYGYYSGRLDEMRVYNYALSSNDTWINAIENANPFHVYQVQVKYDALTSAVCTYQGTNSITWCQ